MDIKKLNCAACGAPISVPDDVDHLNCASCGTFLFVQRGEGYAALKVAEKLARAIEESGKETQGAIREGTESTVIELRRMKLGQELTMAEMQLTNIQTEIRSLGREKASYKIRKQLAELHQREYLAYEKMRTIRRSIASLGGKNPEEDLGFLNDQLGLVQAEISVLKHSNRKSSQIGPLQAEEKRLRASITTIKTQQIRINLKSFQSGALDGSDIESVKKSLAIVDADIQSLRKLGRSPEAKLVEAELNQKRQEFYQIWEQLERERVHSMVTLRRVDLAEEDRERIQVQIETVHADLTTLSKESDNRYAKEEMKQLRQIENKLRRRLNELERQRSKAVSARVQTGGILASLGIGAIVASLWARVASRHTSKSGTIPRNLQASNNATLDRAESEKATPAQSRVKMGLASTQQAGKAFSRYLVAIIIWIAILFGSGLVAMIIVSLTFPTSVSAGNLSPVGVSLTMLFLLLGFAVGEWIFYRRVAPGARIWSRLWDSSCRGLAPRIGLRLVAAVTTGLGVFWFFLSIAMMDDSVSTLMMLMAFLGAPVIGIVVFLRTRTQKTDYAPTNDALTSTGLSSSLQSIQDTASVSSGGTPPSELDTFGQSITTEESQARVSTVADEDEPS